jgi:metal-responsive CopG/Arc/MetJ family transcriptional regulator
MLTRTSIWLDTKSLRALEALAKKKGALKPAQLIRLAIQEYLERNSK